mgnify:CR=1 FL=1
MDREYAEFVKGLNLPELWEVLCGIMERSHIEVTGREGVAIVSRALLRGLSTPSARPDAPLLSFLSSEDNPHATMPLEGAIIISMN